MLQCGTCLDHLPAPIHLTARRLWLERILRGGTKTEHRIVGGAERVSACNDPSGGEKIALFPKLL